MTPTFFKPIALQAKRELASASLDMGSSHLHEQLAALHGFNNAIAFKTYLDKHLKPAIDFPTLVLLDIEKAVARCQALKANVNAHWVVGVLAQTLRQTRDPSTIYFEQDRVSDSLVSFVRSKVLGEPRMQGVIDDAAARLQSTLDEGWGDNRIQRSMSLNSGPVRVNSPRVRLDGRTAVLEATGVYADRNGEEGSFDFEAFFDERRPGIYSFTGSDITFRPGEFEEEDDLIMDFPYPGEV